MSIYKRGRTYWVNIAIPEEHRDKYGGKRQLRESAGTAWEDEAREYERKRRKELWNGFIKPGSTLPPADMTLGQALEKGIAEYWEPEKPRSLRTVKSNASAVERVLGSQTPLKDIDERAVDSLVQALREEGDQDSTINRKLSLLQKLLRMAWLRWKVLDRVPAIERKREAKGRIRVLDCQEEDLLVAALRVKGFEDLADLVVVLVDSGMRLGEALRLQSKDVNFTDELIHVWQTKNDEPRSVPMTERVRAILQARAELEKPFGSLDHNSVAYQWNVVRKELRLDKDPQFVVHALRHTCASRLVRRGVELPVIRDWLGHSSIKTTERYAHLNPEALKKAVGVLESHQTRPPA